MHPYIQQLKEALPQCFREDTTEDIRNAADILYTFYREHYPVDPVEIRRNFSELNDILSKLTLRECDRVWDLCCILCTQHEKRGFLTGLCIGAALAAELADTNR